MKYLLLSFLSFVLIVSCDNGPVILTKKRFDLKNFTEKGGDVEFKKGDSLVMYRDYQTQYYEQRRAPGSNILYTTTFNRSTLIPIAEGNILKKMHIGIWSAYDESGKLVKTSDRDEEYLYSYEQLNSKLINEFGIDLLTTDMEVNVNRHPGYKDNGYKKTYTVDIPIKLGYTGRRLIIDGSTGVILEDFEFRIDDCGTLN